MQTNFVITRRTSGLCSWSSADVFSYCWSGVYSTPDLGVIAFNFSAQLSCTHFRSAAVSHMAEGVVPLCSSAGMSVEPSSSQSKKRGLLDSSASDSTSSSSTSSSTPPASADKLFACLQTLSRL